MTYHETCGDLDIGFQTFGGYWSPFGIDPVTGKGSSQVPTDREAKTEEPMSDVFEYLHDALLHVLYPGDRLGSLADETRRGRRAQVCFALGQTSFCQREVVQGAARPELTERGVEALRNLVLMVAEATERCSWIAPELTDGNTGDYLAARARQFRSLRRTNRERDIKHHMLWSLADAVARQGDVLPAPDWSES